MALLIRNKFETHALFSLNYCLPFFRVWVISLLVSEELSPPNYRILSSQDTLHNNGLVGVASLVPTLNVAPRCLICIHATDLVAMVSLILGKYLSAPGGWNTRQAH